MFQSLLVPLDGSAFAEQALPLAKAIAQRSGAALHVVSVHVPPSALYSAAEMAADLQFDSLVRDQEQCYLNTLTKTLEGVSRGGVTSVLLDGPVAEGLREAAEGIGTDLVVMTTHGRGPMARFWLGSIADKLVRHMSVPMLLVRPQSEPAEAPAPAIKKILIPLDGSALAEEVLGPGTELAQLMGASVALLRVVKPLTPVNIDVLTPGMPNLGPALLEQVQQAHGQVLAEATGYLQTVADRIAGNLTHVETCVRSTDQPALAILEMARSQPETVVALATHGRGGLSRFLVGSVADKIVRGAAAPVLLLRPRGIQSRRS